MGFIKSAFKSLMPEPPKINMKKLRRQQRRSRKGQDVVRLQSNKSAEDFAEEERRKRMEKMRKGGGTTGTDFTSGKTLIG